jgi:hypothetical protein
MSEQQPSREHLQQLYLDIFETDPRGAAIFEDLYRHFASNAKVHTEGGIDAVLKTYRAAAHREVIEYIVRQTNLARHVDETQQAPDEYT